MSKFYVMDVGRIDIVNLLLKGKTMLSAGHVTLGTLSTFGGGRYTACRFSSPSAGHLASCHVEKLEVLEFSVVLSISCIK